jgi:hypothetical protein
MSEEESKHFTAKPPFYRAATSSVSASVIKQELSTGGIITKLADLTIN